MKPVWHVEDPFVEKIWGGDIIYDLALNIYFI